MIVRADVASTERLAARVEVATSTLVTLVVVVGVVADVVVVL